MIRNVNAIIILFLVFWRSMCPTDLFVFVFLTPQESVKLLIISILLLSLVLLKMWVCCEDTKSGLERLSFASVFFWTNLFVRTDSFPSKFSVIPKKHRIKNYLNAVSIFSFYIQAQLFIKTDRIGCSYYHLIRLFARKEHKM